ncbi:MAG: A4/G1 family peptidase [Mycobacterium sp.]|uniref:A4/G1 family peptidase n=1 Tax=Mycobacterium sp. TaxID=1785 RepID=UPI003F978B8E
MTQTKTWIAPEFAEFKRAAAPSPGLPTTDKPSYPPPLDPPLYDYISRSWSGAIQSAQPGHPYTFVAAQWTVPALDLGSALETDPWDILEDDPVWAVSEWIGIDGWYEPTLLQAGTESQAFITDDDSVMVGVWAWWEWYPKYPVTISNLPVHAGDIVVCLICADDTMTGAVTYFTNLTTGKATRFHVTPPSGTKVVGATAEWIVERPWEIPGWPSSWWESPYWAVLPDYDECNFDQCAAGGIDYDIDLDEADIVTMVSSKNDVLSQPQIENDTQLKVTWRKSS